MYRHQSYGYRISYDVKTTGSLTKENINNSSRYIEITPKYYYISKEGTNFDNNIKLYYKNSSGSYVPFNGSNYSIYFKPNDGYRYMANVSETSNLQYMSTKLEELKLGNKFNLKTNMMAINDDSFVQSWYGEFKLPNSTIAIKQGGNVNNPLKDGYIGVIFDIKCVDKLQSGNERRISYNTVDKGNGSKVNTTQWDYEGYLGLLKEAVGRNLETKDNIKIQLEKKTWEITSQLMYEKVKGTVVLFDIDNRAADDFQ